MSGRAKIAEAFLPKVNRIFVDAEFSRDFGDWRTALGLPQRCGELLGRMSSAGHREPP